MDLDLSKFFDRVNHDILMGRLAKRIEDKHLLRLIRRYLEAGILAEGIVMNRDEGTPQGGPLSPLLANVLLDEVDKQLEKRGHTFVRYADDLNVYVGSERAGQRVMEALRSMYAKLKLKVNDEKSAVAKVEDRKFLGFTLSVDNDGMAQRKVAKKSIEKFKDKVRDLTKVSHRSLTRTVRELSVYLRGWKGYFGLADEPYLFGNLDQWIRRRLRLLQLQQWKTGPKINRALMARGLKVHQITMVIRLAGRWWHASGSPANTAMPNKYFDQLGLYRLKAK